MAYNDMYVLDNGNGKYSYEYEINLNVVGNSDWVLLPLGVEKLSCTLSVSNGASAKVQASTDSISTIKTGIPIAVDWDLGAVAASTQDSVEKITALRLVQTVAGNSKLTIRG
ncbi:MAG: hypothetical protein PHP92_04940 [Candidatus Nanoarchaeia archaeon]|nr:hypothetical protein [Candidatus Nanoarchaeia archaeon]